MNVAQMKLALAEVPDMAEVMLLLGTDDGYLEVQCNGVAGVAVRDGRPVVTLTVRQSP